MIEKWLKNELSIKRWRRFKSRKLAILSLWVIGLITFFSLTGEFWANSKPLVMNYQGEIYFPVMKTYHPSEFGITDAMQTNYRGLHFSESDWAIWPIVKWDPFESNSAMESFPSKPTSDNWFGTDNGGRDVFARLLYGYRYSMAYAVLVWLLSFIIGTVFGGVMGYAGGKVDIIGQRGVEIMSTVPQFFLLLIVVSIFQPNLLLLVTLSSFFGWIFISYYIRAEFLKNRKREFVEAAQALGAGHSRIIFKHILPNSLGPIITFSPFVIAGHIVGLAALDYLGFGLVPPTPSWGELLKQAQQYFTVAWWLAVYPSLALFSTLVFLSLIGEAVRDAFDPRK